MRILVLDSSRVLHHVVRRLVPISVEIVPCSSFDAAVDIVERRGVDGVIADLGHADLPWTAFQDLCCEQEPPIPVLFQSSVASRVEESQLGGLCSCNVFISRPYHVDLLKQKVTELLTSMERQQRSPDCQRASMVSP